MEPYQDRWIKGRLTSRGVRECASRYAIIKEFCSQYKRPFTVLDIGSCMSYFIVRLAEDFEECTAVGIESHYAASGLAILKENENPRAMLLGHSASVESIKKIAACEHFDVTLCLSTIHWMGSRPLETFDALMGLGDHLILEIPTESQACGQDVVRQLGALPEGETIGYGKSHLDDSKRRPIVLYSSKKTTTSQSYITGSGHAFNMQIDSDFNKKTATFMLKYDEPRDWLRGINLHTFDVVKGIYPTPAMVAIMLENLELPPRQLDAKVWNIIMQGDAVQWIDLDGEYTGDDPEIEFEKVKKHFRENR